MFTNGSGGSLKATLTRPADSGLMPLVPASGTGMRRGAAARVARGRAGAAEGARHQAQAQGTAAAAARPAAQPAVPAGPGASPSPGGFLRLPCRRRPFCRGSPGSPWGSPRRFLGPKHAVTREPSPHMRRDLRRSPGGDCGGRPARACRLAPTARALWRSYQRGRSGRANPEMPMRVWEPGGALCSPRQALLMRRQRRRGRRRQ